MPVKKEFTFFLKAAFIIISVCFICEIFIFNTRHFVTHWGDNQIDMNNSVCNLVNFTRGEQAGLYIPEGKAEIEFPNINKRVVTVYIDALFNDTYDINSQVFQISYTDEGCSDWTTSKFYVIKGVNESKYVTLQMSGKASYIKIIVHANNDPMIAIRNIILNKPVPLKIFWPRVILFSIIAFCIVVIKRKKLFSLPLKSSSKGQIILTAGIMLAFITYLFTLMLLTAPFSFDWPFKENFAYEPKDQYNAEIVDAILDGHAWLNIEPTEELLALKNPYDLAERSAANVYPPWDHSYYNGKFYSYFGIVQVLVLSLPYKMVTGRYIPTKVAVFIFSALAGIFLMLIWRRLVFRFMDKMPLGMYTLGQLTVSMCSMLSFLTVRPQFYEVAISSALFFTTMGLWLLLGNSVKKKARYIEIALGSLCMALAVGCRANYVFFLLLIPVVLFGELKRLWNNKKQFFHFCVCCTIPCMLVACGLLWYNYIRFGSVLEFGSNYQITVSYIKAGNLINPVAKLTKILIGLLCYLAPSFNIRAPFPFVYFKNIYTGLAYKSYLYITPTFGLSTLPVTWFLLSVSMAKGITDKHRRPILFLTIAMICLGFLQMITITMLANVVNRYAVDFFWLFILSSLFCAYYIYEGTIEYKGRIIKDRHHISLNLCEMAIEVITVIMVISILLIFLVNLSGDGEGNSMIWNNNPAVYYSIQRLLGFNTW